MSFNLVLESVIMKCADMATTGNLRSVEEHLRTIGLSASLREIPDICQVDKLARYLFLCKDLIRLARKPEYRLLFSNIDVITLDAYPGTLRLGLQSKCFVHAEVQQVIHYEHHPFQPAPRAIECSKSACYLCDLFLLKHNQSRISHSHRRLYEKWTIPDVDWMTKTQATAFSTIVQDMTQHLRQTIYQSKYLPWAPYPLESRAFLPLSSGSTASHITLAATSSIDSLHDPAQVIVGSSPSQTSFVRVTMTDLPFRSNVGIGEPPLDVQVDQLHLYFEFIPTVSGQILIHQTPAPVSDNFNEQIRVLEAAEIPMDTEIRVGCEKETSQMRFRLQHGLHLSLEIGFVWKEQGDR